VNGTFLAGHRFFGLLANVAFVFPKPGRVRTRRAVRHHDGKRAGRKRVRDPENILVNKSALVETLGCLGDTCTNRTLNEILDVVTPFARGEIVEPTCTMSAAEAASPLNPFKLGAGKPSDLIDRSIIIHLPVLPARRRRAESDLWAEFERGRPSLFGALCSAVATAIGSDAAPVDGPMPRLADFAIWASRAAPAFGCSAEGFSAIYGRRLAEHGVAAIESSPLALPLVRLALRGPWAGTAADLLYALESCNGRPAYRTAQWPRSASSFADAVRRLAPSLRSVGVDVAFCRQPGTGRRIVSVSVTDAALALAQGADVPAEAPAQRGLLPE
jgi:hypothetical protein